MSTIRETGIHPDLDRDSDSICIENKILTDKHIYFEGSIGEIEGYDFWCREAFLDSDNGIGGGRLDQLVLKHNDEIVARFNHGWDIPPETTEHARAIDAICDRMVSPRPDWDNDPALEFEANIAEDIDVEQELELVDDVELEPVLEVEPDHQDIERDVEDQFDPEPQMEPDLEAEKTDHQSRNFKPIVPNGLADGLIWKR